MTLLNVSAPLLLALSLASCQSASGLVMGIGEDNHFFIELQPPPPESMATIVGKEFVVSSDTDVSLDGRRTRVADLPSGTPVVVIYDLGTRIARTIRATRQKPDKE
jgi:hypothetical protein